MTKDPIRWQDYISADPLVCHGKVCIKGTRVMVSVILDSLAAGESRDAIARAYHISLDDIQASLLYAAELTRDRLVPLATGAA